MTRLISSAILCYSTTIFAISNEEISMKAYAATGNYISAVAELEMELRDANGNVNKRDLTMKKLEGDDGDKTLLEFDSPADVKGTKLLTHEHFDHNDDQWLYMPALKKTKRIISSNKSGAFMGSEFSYEDLSSQHFKRFSYSGDAEKIMLDGANIYKAIRTPNDENSGYSKEIIWVEPKNYLIQRIDYFDKSGNHLKSAYMSKYKKISSVWRVAKVVMKNIQTKKETTLDWISEKIKIGLRPNNFSRSVLR